MEGVLTGEGINEDRNGARASMAGAVSQLNIDNLVSASALDTLNLQGTGTGIQPLPLDWKEVDQICKTAGVDGLLALEVFDTDQANSATTNTVRQIWNIAETGTVNPVRTSNYSQVKVKIAWRFYDNQEKIILDEIRMEDYFGVNNRNGTGIYDLGEFKKRGAIQQAGYLAGCDYAARFLPGWTQFRREFYIRKGRDMKAASRMVQVNEWEDARNIWEPLTKSPKRKIAGRACYNMAIYHEVQGNLDQAIEWAQTAYTKHNDKRARGYVRVLQNRVNSGL